MTRNTCLKIVLFVLGIVFARGADFLSIYLESPPNGGSILLRSEETGSVRIEYSLFGVQQDAQDANRYEFCFEIDSINLGSKVVPFTCMETIHRRLDLANFRPGQYTISAVLREQTTKQIIDYTRIVNTFSVISYTDTLPVIDISAPAGDIHVAASAQSGVAAIDIPFQVLPSSQTGAYVDIALFTVCAMVEDRLSQTVLVSWTCLKNTDRSLSLNQLQRGHAYDIHLRLRDSSNADKSLKSLLASTEVLRSVVVHDLLDVSPSISAAQSRRDYGVEVGETTELQFVYQLSYPTADVYNVKNQLFVCLTLLYSPSAPNVEGKDVETIVPFSCVSAKNDYLALKNMRAGYYRATLAVSLDQKQPLPDKRYSDRVLVEVRRMEEFLPTYHWQALTPWHTIPSGIETRLPIGDAQATRKEARIPNPWRLQLPLPKQLCKKAFFLRMDVFRDTTVMDILEEVAVQCGPHQSHRHHHHHHREEPTQEQLPEPIEEDAESAPQQVSKNLLPSVCFALAVQARPMKASRLLDHPVQEEKEEEEGGVIRVAVEESARRTSLLTKEKVFILHPFDKSSNRPGQEEYADATASTVESIDLFNALHKEIRWVGQDFPDHCPQFEIF